MNYSAKKRENQKNLVMLRRTLADVEKWSYCKRITQTLTTIRFGL